ASWFRAAATRRSNTPRSAAGNDYKPLGPRADSTRGERVRSAEVRVVRRLRQREVRIDLDRLTSRARRADGSGLRGVAEPEQIGGLRLADLALLRAAGAEGDEEGKRG